ncbi:DUF2335 domain-containing protein [Neogemmobacter tilapiae]|uniref:DUF2335 domain-containing protein n=1 Tax=Neogemmobacter tilapiae TaxID=875041 RepID=A0A918TTC1_9RHOB|nr:DUF2335 domain-containing protein [Gemmobacter tilapiae]GHC55725.1 hypothetical protein GCM10007315_18560 [Gemmobacter tilapiae]
MSKEPEQSSVAKPAKTSPDAHQTERLAQRESRTSPDGNHELVEMYAERAWSGALPRPEDFAKFGEVVHDAPERILRMAELEQAHRINLESQIVPANQQAATRGQWLGAAISLTALAGAALTVWLGAPWQVSVAMVGVPVLSVARSLVTAFKADRD